MLNTPTLRSLRSETMSEALRVLRHSMYASTILLCPALFYILFVTIYDPSDPDFVIRTVVIGALCGGICASLYGIGQSTSQERADDSLLLKRTTPLPHYVPFIAKLLATLLLTLLASLLLMPAGLFVTAVPPLKTIVLTWPELLLGTVALSGIGLLQGLFLPPQTAATVSQFVFLLLYLSSGVFIPFDALPSVLAYAAYLLPPYHTVQLMLGDATLTTQLGHGLALAVFALVSFALASWRDKRKELA